MLFIRSHFDARTNILYDFTQSLLHSKRLTNDMTGRRGVFLFRRDLRTVDNLGLEKMVACCDEILGVFVLSPSQVDPKKNPFYGDPAIQFMMESLRELPVLVAYGEDRTVLEEIDRVWSYDHLGFNRDYTPFAKKRDAILEVWCDKHHKTLHTANDYNLLASSMRTKTGGVYSVFTPFYRAAIEHPVETPKTKSVRLRKPIEIPSIFSEQHSLYHNNDKLIVRGGRRAGLRRLRATKTSSYTESRETLSMHTTLLGAYIKFGCVSIREVFAKLRTVEPLMRQLYWREFYAYVVDNDPELLVLRSNFKKDLQIRWVSPDTHFKAWCEGRTGYPLVDAGMRQLNTVGWMHNRARMVTASFLVKHLGIDWRLGEQYFASRLVDYDPCSNNGGWQWCAGTGADAQPYFRIFNPWTQNAKHDPECVYVKRWIPELKEVEKKRILKWYEETSPKEAYPLPIVDHKDARARALRQYSKIKQQ